MKIWHRTFTDFHDEVRFSTEFFYCAPKSYSFKFLQKNKRRCYERILLLSRQDGFIWWAELNGAPTTNHSNQQLCLVFRQKCTRMSDPALCQSFHRQTLLHISLISSVSAPFPIMIKDLQHTFGWTLYKYLALYYFLAV